MQTHLWGDAVLVLSGMHIINFHGIIISDDFSIFLSAISVVVKILLQARREKKTELKLYENEDFGMFAHLSRVVWWMMSLIARSNCSIAR